MVHLSMEPIHNRLVIIQCYSLLLYEEQVPKYVMSQKN